MIIYKAENKINGNCYIGKTIKSLNHRRNIHLWDSKNNSDFYFHRAIRKYGIENFKWSILCETNSKSKLNALEKFYIACHRKMHKLYNMSDGGDGGAQSLPEIKAKMIESNRRRKLSAESRNKISETLKGRKDSEEVKNKKSKARIGCSHSEETKQKISQSHVGAKNPFYNKNHTEESRQKMSRAQKLRFKKIKEVG